MFEKFESRIILSGTLTTCTALHIGSAHAKSVELTDSPVIKDANSHPFIPGSSFKGALRAAVERIVSGLNHEKVKSCYITSEGKTGCLSTDTTEEFQKNFEHEKSVLVTGEADLTVVIEAHSCDVCKIFGSTHLSSRVFIQDLILSQPRGKKSQRSDDFYQARDGVAIDRDSDTAAERLKYDFEVVYPGTAFDFGVIVENASKEQLGLLLGGLRQFEGYDDEETQARKPGRIPLGGMKSRGLGWVDLTVDKVEIIDEKGDFSQHENAKLVNYLLENQGQVLRGNKAEEFIQDMVQAFVDKL